jgi:hypothetical protein
MEDPRFKEGFKKYLDNVRNNSYIFELSKCCGYSEIVPTFKNATCADLYRNIMCQFEIKEENKIKVYATITDASNNTMVIQNDKTPIRNIILENASFFKPIYPLPTTVVYKLVYKFETEEINCGCCSCNSQK